MIAWVAVTLSGFAFGYAFGGWSLALVLGGLVFCAALAELG